MKNSQIELQRALIENDNINVSKTNVLGEFFILAAGFIGFILVIIMSLGFISDIYINKMSDETQAKIENIVGFLDFKKNKDFSNNEEYEGEIERLNKIKMLIISNDSSLKEKKTAKLPILISKNKDINAYIFLDGTIYVTTGTLSQNYTDEELAFIIAHEIGHYVHRDHLRTVGRQILIGTVIGFFSSQTEALQNVLAGTADMENLSHSRRQEKEADKYAGQMLIKIYGSNEGGKSFINKIKEKQNAPEFVQYFSSHPSWNKRIKILENQ